MSSCKKVDIMLSPSSKQIHKPITNQVLFMALSAPRGGKREKERGQACLPKNSFSYALTQDMALVSGIVPNLGFRSIPAGDKVVPSISLSKIDHPKGDVHNRKGDPSSGKFTFSYSP